jgi:hypothetical protein
MSSRTVAGTALTFLLMSGAWCGAQAQQPVALGAATNQSGWTFNIAPYLWLPQVNATLGYHLPPELGGRLPTDVSSGPGDYLSHLDFAAMLAADVRHGPFSLLTDFMFTRFSATGSSTHIKSVDFDGSPSLPISRSLQTDVGTTSEATIWTLAGGYTVLRGDWGNLDLFAGFRLLAVSARTDFNLALTLTGPRGNGATFGGNGRSISGTQDIWNGIAGFRGNLRLGHTRLFIPYYFDIGAGGSQLTWQIATGLGYQFRWGAVSATYRYLSFEQGGNAVVRHMSLGGPVLMASFSF